MFSEQVVRNERKTLMTGSSFLIASHPNTVSTTKPPAWMPPLSSRSTYPPPQGHVHRMADRHSTLTCPKPDTFFSAPRHLFPHCPCWPQGTPSSITSAWAPSSPSPPLPSPQGTPTRSHKHFPNVVLPLCPCHRCSDSGSQHFLPTALH